MTGTPAVALLMGPTPGRPRPAGVHVAYPPGKFV